MKQLTLCLLSLILFSSSNASHQADAYNFCEATAKSVTKMCVTVSEENLSRCYIEGMQQQDFKNKKDFLIDSDKSITCFNFEVLFPHD